MSVHTSSGAAVKTLVVERIRRLRHSRWEVARHEQHMRLAIQAAHARR